MSAARATADRLQVSLLSDEWAGFKGLPKDAIEALAHDIVPPLSLRVYIFETGDVIPQCLDISTMKFVHTATYGASDTNFKPLALTNGDIAIVENTGSFTKINRASKMRSRPKKIELGVALHDTFRIQSLTRLRDDSDVYVSFSNVFMQHYCQIDFSTSRVISVGTNFNPTVENLGRFGGRNGTFYDVGRGRSLFKKQGSIDGNIPVRLALLDVNTKQYIELPSAFEEGDTLNNIYSYVGMADGSIMMISGYPGADADESTLRCSKLNLETMAWTDIAPIPWNSHDSSSLLLPNGQIFAIFDYDSKLDAYAYDPTLDKWTTIPIDFEIRGELTGMVIGN